MILQFYGNIWAGSWQNLSSGFPTSSHANQVVQPQKMAKGLKFWIWEVERLYYLCSENKGAVLFSHMRKAVFLMTRLIFSGCTTVYKNQSILKFNESMEIISSSSHNTIHGNEVRRIFNDIWETSFVDSAQKHMLWVLIRSASARHFLWVPTIYDFVQKLAKFWNIYHEVCTLSVLLHFPIEDNYF